MDDAYRIELFSTVLQEDGSSKIRLYGKVVDTFTKLELTQFMEYLEGKAEVLEIINDPVAPAFVEVLQEGIDAVREARKAT
jgi:hypothetical protein